jgi:hypothetical protein
MKKVMLYRFYTSNDSKYIEVASLEFTELGEVAELPAIVGLEILDEGNDLGLYGHDSSTRDLTRL